MYGTGFAQLRKGPALVGSDILASHGQDWIRFGPVARVRWRHPASAFDDPDMRISDLDSIFSSPPAAVCCWRAVASWNAWKSV